MGGVINIVTSRPTRHTIELKPQYGNQNTPKMDLFASDIWKNVGFAVEGSALNTDGYKIVPDIEAGPIDNNANVKYGNVTGKIDYSATERLNLFGRVGYFSEDRNNGKIGELNGTRWTTLSGGARVRLPDQSDLQASVFGDIQKTHYNFLAVSNAATTRNFVRLATDQHVPVNGAGGMAQWTKVFGTMQAFSAGADWRWVTGESQEVAYNAIPGAPPGPDGVTLPAAASIQRASGGSQLSQGAFVQDVITPTAKIVITLNARLDHWRNYDGHFDETTIATGAPTANNRPTIPDRTDTVGSPRVAALYHLTDRITTWGAWNSGFRAPTLTELYRQFSVGTVVTKPNDQLGPERLKGGELGASVAPAKNLTARVTWFDNRVTNPISNVTMTSSMPNYATICVGLTPGNCVQKQNLGATRIWGVQTDVEYLIGRNIRLSGGYMYDQAKVTDGGTVNAALASNCPGNPGQSCFIPQVPVHRGSFQVAYNNAKYVNASLTIMASALQYNDDQNIQFIPATTLAHFGYSTSTTAGLPGYATADLLVSKDFGERLQVFFGAQNLTNKVYFVQTNPSTVGTPRLVNVGVVIRFTAK
jgi:outer membrane receptor protein involved in Fe transport